MKRIRAAAARDTVVWVGPEASGSEMRSHIPHPEKTTPERTIMTKETPVKLRSASVRRVRRITAGLAHHRAPAWSPDGQRLVSACGSGGDSAWVLSDRKGRLARVLEGPVEGAAAIAPDHTVAYGRQVGGTSEIWILPSGGTSPRRLLGADGRLYRDPAFSPDGRSLCYSADNGPGSALRLWLLALDSLDSHAQPEKHERAELLVDPSGELMGGGDARPISLGHPSWSPTGERIFFEGVTAAGPVLFVFDRETGEAQRLTGPGYRRPTALSSTLLCAERDDPRGDSNGGSEIVLCELRPGREPRTHRLREAALTARSECARDPAVCPGRGKKSAALLCWAMPGKKRDGEPQRYDLHIGELAGLRPRKPRSRPADDPNADSSHATAETTEEPAILTERAWSASGERPVPHGLGLNLDPDVDGERGPAPHGERGR